MSLRGRYSTIPFLVVGFLILVPLLLLWSWGELVLLELSSAILAPITAFLMGLVGLYYFGRESLAKEDRFNQMNVFFSLGLVLFAISEVAGGFLGEQEGSELFHFIFGLVQLPGLLLWAIGVLGYLRSSNTALGVASETKLIGSLIVVPTVFVTVVASVSLLVAPARNPVEVLATAPLAIGLGFVMCALVVILWIFREGKLAQPIFLAFLTLVLVFIRIAAWCFIGFSPLEPVGRLLGAEAYVLLGASIAAAKGIEHF
ncbi:MAG: hypothetical protein JSW05_10265 [Candidatus Thorarchaeota archaeon]|nr:MAG: hypothetical protein JSW05_10265 [Candidatus Thorarchaeota archaeon]